MKRLFIIFFLFFTSPIFAQHINGLIIDFNSHLPISNVQIISKNETVLTDNEGRFSLAKIIVGDKLSFRMMGYETQEIVVLTAMINKIITFELKSDVQFLSAITIMGKRNYQLDSLKLRKEFDKEFNYKSVGIKDMFITIDPNYIPPMALRKPNSISAIASINLLQILSLNSKNKIQRSKLKEVLLHDEEANYVDHIFSKSKVESITSLKGDSLKNFMQKYRPSAEAIKKMNDYEIVLYIKKQYKEFIKP
jgi:hypothetical protein